MMKLVSRLTFLAVFLVMAIAPATVLAQDGEVVCETYNEAPELAERVAAGELPPVEERLPVNPLVVEPAQEIGQYGGTFFDLYGGGRISNFRTYGYDNLVRWSVDGSEIIPNQAEGWEISEDGTTYTFFLREGMKWSDGEDFNADDIMFWWEEIETDEVINPNGPQNYFYIQGELPTVTKIDDYTVEFSWNNPNSLFLQNLATSYGARVTMFAEHYLSQFDPDFNAEGVEQMMAEAGNEDFRDWWLNTVGVYGWPSEHNDPERPHLLAWVPTEPYFNAERFTFVRNPYYFKIDPACNQLPYIGERVWTFVQDAEVALLKTIDGEASFSVDTVSVPPNRAVFFDNMDEGNYRFVEAVSSNYQTMQLHISFNHPDPVQAEIMQDKNFRVGLSQALDRQTIIDTVYIGQGIPYQQAPRPESPFYDEELATQYTEYDVDAANAALDMVLPEKDGDGFRLRPDGERFVFTVLANPDFRSEWPDILQFYERYWEAVGIETNIVISNDDVWRQRREDPDIHAHVWVGENGSGQLPLLAAGGYTPEAAWGWRAWETITFRDPDAVTEWEPVEPPAALQRQYEILGQIETATSLEEQTALMEEHLELAKEQFFTIGLSLPAGDYYVADVNLRNIPDQVLRGWLYPGPAPSNYETFYFANES